MDKLIIQGPNELKGEVTVSSSKNSTLPILAASLLFPHKITFSNLPSDLKDIRTMLRLMEKLGVVVEKDSEGKVSVDASRIKHFCADYDLVKTMRASILVLGPLLTRFGEAQVSLPGGCAIGARPIDIHLNAIEKLGAKMELEQGYVRATSPKLHGNRIVFPFPSVGATENLMMAAAFAEGDTILENVAQEPEIVDLANFLRFMGVKVEGDGTQKIVIQGTVESKTTKPTSEYSIIPDRIEAATFIIAGLMTNSEILIKNCIPGHMDALLDVLEKMGAKMERGSNFLRVFKSGRLKAQDIVTAPFPGFPTDMQAQIMALASISEGSTVITENIFENRFMHVPELIRMGADVTLRGSSAIVKGVSHLSAAPVMCTDLRASAALVLAALVTKGETSIQRIYHLDRGYEGLELKLQALGAQVRRVKETE